jgi:WD40 repeat protein
MLKKKELVTILPHDAGQSVVAGLVELDNGDALALLQSGTMIMWSVKTGELIKTIECRGVQRASNLILLKNGAVAFISNSETIQIRSLNSGQLVQTLVDVKKPPGYKLEILIALTNGNLVSANWPLISKNFIQIWNAESGQILKRLDSEGVSCLLALPNE